MKPMPKDFRGTSKEHTLGGINYALRPV